METSWILGNLDTVIFTINNINDEYKIVNWIFINETAKKRIMKRNLSNTEPVDKSILRCFRATKSFRGDNKSFTLKCLFSNL